MTQPSYTLVLCKSRFHFAIWSANWAGFFPQKIWWHIDTKNGSATMEPKQEAALFSLVTIPRWQWNSWNSCGNSAVQNKRNPLMEEAKTTTKESDGNEVKQLTGIHSLENAPVLCQSLLPLWYETLESTKLAHKHKRMCLSQWGEYWLKTCCKIYEHHGPWMPKCHTAVCQVVTPTNMGNLTNCYKFNGPCLIGHWIEGRLWQYRATLRHISR